MNNKKYCSNCKIHGHYYNNCKNIITSNGIIAINNINNTNNINNDYKFLLIRRRNSLGYIEFLRGKYNIHNMFYLKNIIFEMSINEKSDILNNDFDTLWCKLWGIENNNDDMITRYKNEKNNSKFKFNKLKEGFLNKKTNVFYNLIDIIKKSPSNWVEPEWGFPKGRKNYQEYDIDCAIREFEEETGYKRDNITLINNILPLEEIFVGSNYKSYKHKYYIAFMKNINLINNNYNDFEVGELRWCSYNEVLNLIRPYNLDKLNLIKSVKEILNNYTLY